jgi:hypothetical protein
MAITLETIKALPDDELDRVLAAAGQEKKERIEREKQATIARIRELADSVGVRISIGGGKARPSKGRAAGNGGAKAAVSQSPAPAGKKTG